MSKLKCMSLVAAFLMVYGNSVAQTVSNTKELLTALGHAQQGAVISLNPGLYQGVDIQHFNGYVTITSANLSDRAVLGDLYLRYSSGVNLNNLIFDTTYMPTSIWGGAVTIPFQVADSKYIRLDHLLVHGSPTGTLATDNSGIIVRESDHVTVSNTEFTHIHSAINQINNTYLTIRNNQCHNLRDDCVRGGGSNYVTISYNHCWSNHPDGATDPDHPDCVQFWTSGTAAAAHDIYIGYNTYERGTGNVTQGIFVRDETLTMPYRNLVIEGNVTKGASGAGVSVDGAINPIVQNNYSCAYPDWVSGMAVRNTQGTLFQNNSATNYGYENNTALLSVNNHTIGFCP